MGYVNGATTINQQSATAGPTTTAKPTTPRPQPKPVGQANAVKVLPDSEVAIVDIVMGLKEEPPTRGSDLGTPVWDDDFDFSLKSAQAALEATCKLAVERRAQLATRKHMCFVNDFRVFLLSKGKPGYPVAGTFINSYLQEFLMTIYGKDYREDAGFTSDGGKVRWVRAKFYTDLPRDMAASDAWKWVERWDDFVDDLNSAYRGSGTGKIFHTSELWVRAETEERLIESTLLCAAFSVFFALLAVLVFLWNLALAVYLILGIVCVIICLASVMFGVMQWTFGAVEAIGLIVFVGFSVDYSLHMAESFNQSAETQRFDKVKDAMLRTGGAVFAAAVTSALAGLPILLCTIQVFVKFGVTIVLNTSLSLFFSLGFLCALLMIIGPENNFGSCDMLCDLFYRRQRDDQTPVVPGTTTVVGTVVGTNPGNNPAGDYRWGGGAPSTGSGYKWDTGEDDADDPKKPQKGAPQKGAPPSSSTDTGTLPADGVLLSQEDNSATTFEDNNPVLQQPVRVTTPEVPPTVAATRAELLS